MKATYAWLSGVAFGFFFASAMWYQNLGVIVVSLVLGVVLSFMSKITKSKKEVRK